MLAELRDRTPAMLDELAALVAAESPTADLQAITACADTLAGIAEELVGARPDHHTVDGRPHLLWRFGGATRVLLLGHLDTVWPLGTTARWPFAVADGTATGPGAFDMKAGLVQGLHALSVLDDLDGVALLVTADEETGSPTSRALVEDSARGADAVLVLEPSAHGALKTTRKGVSTYRLDITGRAAHAGLEPEKGVNALTELAHQVLAIAELAAPSAGTTVTPTLAAAGSAVNVVPAAGVIEVDVRVATAAEQARVDEAMRALGTDTPGAAVQVTGGPNRPPLDEASSADLLTRARRVADELGVGPLAAAAVGGGSDGNFTAGMGIPTLDGLGAVGDGAHAEGEHVVVNAMPDRAALVAGLVADLLGAS